MPNDRQSDFVHKENIKDFEERLMVETDLVKRRLLTQLLAEEKAGSLSPPKAQTRTV